MSATNELIENMVLEEKNRVREFLNKLLSKWYWFVLFGFLGGAAGFGLSHFSQPSYRVESMLLVQTESKSMRVENFSDDYDQNTKTNIKDHIGVLKSYSLTLQALQNLSWNVSWFKKGWISDEGLYKKEPFGVEDYEDYVNLPSVPLLVSVLPNDNYSVEVDAEVEIQGSVRNLVFKEFGKWGEPFENEFFRFVLTKPEGMKIAEYEEYYFQFNNREKMALDYTKKLQVKQDEVKGNLINLQIDGSEPAREVAFLNELSRVFLEFCLREKNRTSENTVRFIDSQLEGIVDSLRQAGLSFSDFRSRNHMVNLSQEASLVMERLEDLEAQRSRAEIKLEYYQNLRRYLSDTRHIKHVEANLKRNFDTENEEVKVVAPSVVGITDPTLNALVLKLSELNGKRRVLSYSVKEKNPSMLQLDREIRHTRQSLEENLENLLNNAEIETKSLDKRMKKINTQLAKLPKTEQKLINIKRRFDLNNELYTFLLKKRAGAAITKAGNVSDSQVLDPARVITAEKVGPKTGLNVVFGILAGCLLPFLVLKLDFHFSRTIRTRNEVERATSIPVIGTITHNRFRKEVPVIERPRSGITESFRCLRTNLEYLLKENSPKVISVLSTIPGEGKSFTCINLAAILAMKNEKVLLVGADMRRPRLKEVFQTSGTHGLSSYLTSQHSFDEVLNSTKVENLSFVPAGPLPSNPAELLANGKFEKFIIEARSRFDYIILDSAPISLVTDGILAARHANSCLFLVRQGYSNKDQIKLINEVAEQGGISKLMLVLNDFKGNGSDSNYMFGKRGYRKGYYSDYHKGFNGKIQENSVN
jgi:capsular exopolysaccharide synthesis family protein